MLDVRQRKLLVNVIKTIHALAATIEDRDTRIEQLKTVLIQWGLPTSVASMLDQDSAIKILAVVHTRLMNAYACH